MTTYNEQFEQLVSELNVEYSSPTHNPEALNRYNQCCYAEHKTSQIALFPTKVEQIQQILASVKKVNTDGGSLKIYTISTGQNWGYGSASPTSDDAVLLVLKQLNSEPEWVGNQHDTDGPYGKKLGIVRIEAGVTQQQLYEFLQREGGEFWMDATGSAVTCSVLANTLERGFGHTPYGDHFEHLAGMELLLPDGRFVKTGHAGCENAANVGVHKQGIGPVLEGLGSQSNLFIVTAIYLQLMPAKKKIWKYFIKLNGDQAFFDAVEQLRPLKLNGTLSSQMHCANVHKGIQAVMRYPFKEMNDKFPMSQNLIDKYAKENQLTPWAISGALYGDSNLEVLMKWWRLWRSLKGGGKTLLTVPEGLAKLLKRVFDSALIKSLMPGAQKKMSTQFTLLNELLKLKKGQPTNFFLESCYHRKRDISNKTNNPDVDKAGLIWIAPIGPMTKDTVKLLVDNSTEISEKYGFDPAISITLLNQRAVDCVLSIIFDRTNEEEDRNAVACYDELLTTFNSLGFTSYRSSARAMINEQLNFGEDLQHLHSLLKQGIDPDNILSPGHYIKSQ